MGAPCVDWQDESRYSKLKTKEMFGMVQLRFMNFFKERLSTKTKWGFGHLIEQAVWNHTQMLAMQVA